MHRILVSSCLLGMPTRYDGGEQRCRDAIFDTWLREGRLVPLCPETAGGLPVPRPPAEIAGPGGGAAVVTGASPVVDVHGADVSAAFLAGARAALALVLSEGIRLAVLKERSPSCGVHHIYDGSFTGVRTAGAGVTTALLRQAGIAVFSEEQLEEAQRHLAELEG